MEEAELLFHGDLLHLVQNQEVQGLEAGGALGLEEALAFVWTPLLVVVLQALVVVAGLVAPQELGDVQEHPVLQLLLPVVRAGINSLLANGHRPDCIN